MERLKGAGVAVLVGLLAVGGHWAVGEWSYYRQLKAEHQWFHEEAIGTLPNGKPLTRKLVFDLMLAELAKGQGKAQ